MLNSNIEYKLEHKKKQENRIVYKERKENSDIIIFFHVFILNTLNTVFIKQLIKSAGILK